MSLVAYVEIYALFGGDQTDPKPACGGPNSFLRTGGRGPNSILGTGIGGLGFLEGNKPFKKRENDQVEKTRFS